MSSGQVQVLVKPSPNPNLDPTRLTVKLPKHLHMCVCVCVVINPKINLSFQLTLLSHSHSLSISPLVQALSPQAQAHSLSISPSAQVVTTDLFCSILFKIFFFSFHILYFSLRCLFQLFVSYESHFLRKGMRNHMTSLPETQTKSHLPSKGMFSFSFLFFSKTHQFLFC